MKKFNKKDLSIHRKEIASLDGKNVQMSNGGRAVTDESDACHTAETCMCENTRKCDTRLECPTEYFCHTQDIGDCDHDTYFSYCVCESKPGCADSIGCNPTQSKDAICCELPETQICVPYTKDGCNTTQCLVSAELPCETNGTCVNDTCVIVHTKYKCTETEDCLLETVNDAETCVCISSDCETNGCISTIACVLSRLCMISGDCDE